MRCAHPEVLPLHQESLVEKNSAISIVRVLSVFMIIGCHLATWFGSNVLTMILNVGVYVFLLISGILYAGKKIDHGIAFLKKRWLKLCTPMYFLVLFLLIVNLIQANSGALKSIPTYLFNLQGTGFLVLGVDLYQMNGLGHLWFLTAIMICYLLLVLVKRMEHSCQLEKHIALTFAVFWIADILFAYTVKLQLHYFIAYFIGYTIGKNEWKISLKYYSIATLLMISAMIIRLLVRKYADGTILYDNLVVPFTHIILAVWIYQTIQFLCQKAPKMARAIAMSRGVRWIEKLSLYLYMTHYMFLVGPLYVSNIPLPRAGQLMVFFIGTLISALILQFISEKVVQKLTGLLE